MPDADGRIRGISVPELPWQKDRDQGMVREEIENQKRRNAEIRVWAEAQKAAAIHWAGTD